MSLDWVVVKQLVVIGILGLLWPWIFRTVVKTVISWEGEELPQANLRTVLLSLGLAIALPLLGQTAFAALSTTISPMAARIAAMLVMGGILGWTASWLPYITGPWAIFGGLLGGLLGGLTYGSLAWPFSAVASLTLLAAGPMLGLSSPGSTRWKKMVSGASVYGWRGRIG